MRILLSSSALTMRQLPIPYQRSISPEAFYPIAGARSGMPYRTVENKYRCVFWYSLLKLFTHTSIPVWNPLSLEFIGAMPCGSGCLKRLNTLTSRRIIPESRQAKNGALDPLVLVTDCSQGTIVHHLIFNLSDP
jgi:hypothetical protein